MRVALVGPTHPYKGGVAQHTTRLAHELGRAGNDVDLLSWSAQYPGFLYPGQQRVRDDRPEVETWPRTSYPLSWSRPDGWWRMGRRLRTYDLVALTLVTPVQVPAYLVLRYALRGTTVRTVAVCHNVLPHERRPGDRASVRALLRRVDVALVHSREQADLAASLGARRVAVAALPPAFPPGDERSHPAGDGTPFRRLLFFGLVRPYKGLDVLLRALTAVPGVALTVAGEFWGGPAETERTVRELGLTDRVELRPGYVDAADLPALFRGVDALVLPYRAATASANPDTAFRYGVPVVVTRAGALSDRVTDGVDGLVCPPGDADGLAAALGRLYAEPGLLATLRAGVRPPDQRAAWAAYTSTLTTA